MLEKNTLINYCWDEKVVSFPALVFASDAGCKYKALPLLVDVANAGCLFTHWSSDDSSVDREKKKKKSSGAYVSVILLLENYPGNNVFPSKIINMYQQIRFTFHIHVLITY